ncbi:sigma-70 family RNA polymerase sigma factor [Streptomyces purpureus]|uniref:BACON domain-containing protein n=1 Tax=Streptomyces purpureus TaxID=1951 RepID=UPI00035FD8EF|nr:sigma-70 family RNA polymerase sigma factor [Streptomyces purpureus]
MLSLAYRRRVTSSRLEPPTHTTGAHRAHRRAPRSVSDTPAGATTSSEGSASRTLRRRPPSRYEPYLDGLFTYCLAVLCDHDTATAVLGDVLAIAERQHGRCPADEAERKAWLYALARWACLRSLGEQRRKRQGAHTGRPAVVPPTEPPVSEETAERRRAELALLAWPEAAGTTPEQREALELAVRHQLAPKEVAAVLGLDPLAARDLLASAACEVERTRAALAVVETGSCATVARLTGDHQVLLSAALRRELVRHVDDCPRCRRVAERAGASGPWPGASVTPARLPVVEAPRAAAYVAMLHVPRARAGAPRFGPGGFPMDPKDHAARRDRLRARAVTTTVVAAVVAAPVLALWAAYRGAPLTGEAQGGSRVTASEVDEPAGMDVRPPEHYENTGNARTKPDSRFTTGGRTPDVGVEVISTGTPAPPGRPGHGPGRLTVTAQPADGATVLTLTASGGEPVVWTLWTDAPWLVVSRTSGTLRPGESVTIHIAVDHAREPHGPWSGRVGVEPAGAVVEIGGHGAPAPPSSTPPSPQPPSSEPPTAPPSSQPPSSQPPSPTPTPTPSQSVPPSDPATAPPSPG